MGSNLDAAATSKTSSISSVNSRKDTANLLSNSLAARVLLIPQSLANLSSLLQLSLRELGQLGNG